MERGIYMSVYQDKQIRFYFFFLIFFSLLLFGMGILYSNHQIQYAKQIYMLHNEAIVSSLLEQGISKDVIAVALTNTQTSETGKDLLSMIGMDNQVANHTLPHFAQFQQTAYGNILMFATFLTLVLFVGTMIFFWKRKQLYLQAENVINNYIHGDFSLHLPQNQEGILFQLFSSVEQLSTMLQSKNETEHKTKVFLKNTISDISHQLKTPLAALTMYHEIIESEPDNIETIKVFSEKIGISLNRMEQLIQSMLKITRLDSGNIIFDKKRYPITEVITYAIHDLTTRANHECKKIIVDGNPSQLLLCDIAWTSEAIGNIVKNGLDHTKSGDTIRITWEHTPAMFRIFISDNGAGIPPEDIYHIFKRFYRSKHSTNTSGVGLGLPLAKSIIEGQNGLISVQSDWHHSTTFILSFLTEL